MKKTITAAKERPAIKAKDLDEVFQASLEHDLGRDEVKTLARRVAVRERVLRGRAVPGKVKGAQFTSPQALLTLEPGRYVRVTLVRSPIDRISSHQETVKSLGLKKMHQTVIVRSSPSLRGAIKKVSYLIEAEEFEID